MSKFLVPAIVAALSMTGLGSAIASEINVTGKVTGVETSYMGGSVGGTPFAPTVVFSLDTGAASCPAGTNLRWDGKWASPGDPTASVRATTAALLTALAGDRPVQFYFESTDTTCVGHHLWIKQ
jgi:hypothetical protein